MTAPGAVRSPAWPAVTARLTGRPGVADRRVPGPAVAGRGGDPRRRRGDRPGPLGRGAESRVPGVRRGGTRLAGAAGIRCEGDVVEQQRGAAGRVQGLDGDEALLRAAVAGSERRGEDGLGLQGGGCRPTGVHGHHGIVARLAAVSRRLPFAEEQDGGRITLDHHVDAARAGPGQHYRDGLVVEQARGGCHGERSCGCGSGCGSGRRAGRPRHQGGGQRHHEQGDRGYQVSGRRPTRHPPISARHLTPSAGRARPPRPGDPTHNLSVGPRPYRRDVPGFRANRSGAGRSTTTAGPKIGDW